MNPKKCDAKIKKLICEYEVLLTFGCLIFYSEGDRNTLLRFIERTESAGTVWSTVKNIDAKAKRKALHIFFIFGCITGIASSIFHMERIYLQALSNETTFWVCFFQKFLWRKIKQNALGIIQTYDHFPVPEIYF
jgi:hypothetical protein